MLNQSNILFLTFVSTDYSRSSVYLNDEQNYSHSTKIQLTPNFYLFIAELWRERKRLREKNAILVVLSPCSILVPFLKTLTRRPIVLDAGWPLTDAELGKSKTLVNYYKYIKAWLIDILAFHLAKMTILESNAQRLHVSKNYLVSKSKLQVLFTGVNENKYHQKHKVKNINKLSKFDNIIKKDFVFFRGKNNVESGIDNIIKLADYSKNAYNFVILTNKIPNSFKARENVLFISEYIADFEIALLYQKCFLSLGQLSDSKRLDRTIPHKAFESGYFGTPYLTLRRDGIAEFLSDESEAIFVDTLNMINIAKIIEEFYSNFSLQRALKINIKKKYLKIASQTELKREFFRILDTIN